MKKRGISPLIATVLLIGFAVIIAVSVWMWYGNIVKGQFMKQGALAQIQSDCLTEIELQVISANPSASSTGSDITIEIKNSGNKIFNGIRILVNNGEDVLSVKETFNPTEDKSITVTSKIFSPESVAVMPMIVRQGVPGTCSDKKVVYDLNSR